MSDTQSRMTPAVFFSGLLMVAGVLIAIGAGLCSTVVTIMGLASARNSSEFTELLTMGVPMVGLIGGIPFAVGLALFFGGRKWSRSLHGGRDVGPPPNPFAGPPPPFGGPNDPR